MRGKERVRQSKEIALGGIVAALSVALMFASVIPVFTYTLPAVAGVLLTPVVFALDKKWAWMVYVVTSLLSLLLIVDKEAAVMYAVFFGYYPIVKPLLEKVRPKVLAWVCKLAVFNAAVIVAEIIVIYVLGVPMEAMKQWGIPLLMGLANVIFFLYDYVLSQVFFLFRKKWQKRLRIYLKK